MTSKKYCDIYITSVLQNVLYIVAFEFLALIALILLLKRTKKLKDLFKDLTVLIK